MIVKLFTISGVPKFSCFTSDVTYKNLVMISRQFFPCVGECPMYIHANFQEATIYIKKVTWENEELYEKPL